MSNALKCPNPSCPYLFDPTGVPGGVVLTCPRCGMRFTLGSPSPPTSGTGIPAPPPPPAAEPEPRDHHDPRGVREELLPDRGDSGTRQAIFWVVTTVALLAGFALTVYFYVFRDRSTDLTDTASRLDDYNVAFDPPAAPWERDGKMEAQLGAPILVVYRKAGSDAYMAFGAKDFKDRRPRPSELREGLEGPLRRVFPAESIRREALDPVTWMGQTAGPVFKFSAQVPDGPLVKGECYAVHAKGVAYWAICWAGEGSFIDVVAEFDSTRNRFKLLKLREQWAGGAPAVTTFGGHAADYRLLDGEGIWREQRNPEQQDPPADLHLTANLRARGADTGAEAELWVYLIDPGGDPLKQAQEHVEAVRRKQMTDANPKFVVTFKPIETPPEGDPPIDTVDTPTPVVRLNSEVQQATGQHRLIVVSGIVVGNKLVVVRAECEMKDRDLFETKMMQLAGSLRAGK